MQVLAGRHDGVEQRSAPPWRRGAAAVAAGALPALAFPAPALWWLAYVALVPWLLLVRAAPTPRRAALDGWLGGAGFMIAVHHWLMPSLNVFIVVVAGLLGLFWAPWGVLVRATLGGAPSRARTAAALAVVPSGWLMIELARSWEGLGGPWGLLGASQWQVAPALRLASVGGVWLLSLLVVAVNTAVTMLVSMAGARITATVGIALCVITVGSAWAWAPAPERSGVARIGVVQTGGIAAGAAAVENRFTRSETLTRKLTGQDLNLVVWGESSVGADLRTHPGYATRLAALSRTVGADVLVNVDARSTDPAGRTGIFKRSVLVGPAGATGDAYDKMRLVPFGEYIPFRSALSWATSVGRAASEDRVRGTRQVVMTLPGHRGAASTGGGATDGGGLRIGPLICFETAFPDMSRQLVRDGAQLIVAQSSTSSFQHSWAPQQHASLAALRAAETGRPMVHATLTGISAVFGPGGERVGEPLGTDRRTAAVFDVPLADGTTPYVRFGDWAVHAALLVVLAFCAAEGARSFRRSRRAPLVPPARTAHESAGRPAR